MKSVWGKTDPEVLSKALGLTARFSPRRTDLCRQITFFFLRHLVKKPRLRMLYASPPPPSPASLPTDIWLFQCHLRIYLHRHLKTATQQAILYACHCDLRKSPRAPLFTRYSDRCDVQEKAKSQTRRPSANIALRVRIREGQTSLAIFAGYQICRDERTKFPSVLSALRLKAYLLVLW